tara:strand:- start:414 stop:608 length:195 start_codon:yes stop_codon:yes gene_type:complete
MKASELRSKSVEELDNELSELRKARFSLSMQMATQQTNNTSEAKKIRRNIARVNTVIREKERTE